MILWTQFINCPGVVYTRPGDGPTRGRTPEIWWGSRCWSSTSKRRRGSVFIAFLSGSEILSGVSALLSTRCRQKLKKSLAYSSVIVNFSSGNPVSLIPSLVFCFLFSVCSSGSSLRTRWSARYGPMRSFLGICETRDRGLYNLPHKSGAHHWQLLLDRSGCHYAVFLTEVS